MSKQFDGTQGNGYQPLPTYGRLHDSLQNHFGMIEEAGRSMRKYSVYFPAMNPDILDELKAIKRRVEGLIVMFETFEQATEESHHEKLHGL